MRSKTRFSVATVVLALTGITLTSSAEAFVVFDPNNFKQNLLTATRMLEQINHQVQQLQNQALMLVNQGRNLKRLDFNVLAELRTTLATTDRLMQEAGGLAYEVSRMDQQFARLYPDDYDGAATSVQMANAAREQERNSREALRTAARVQAQVAQNSSRDAATLTRLIERSQSAVGQLQATQATNQLLALQAQQTIQAQQLQITQGRALALEQARLVSVDARAREIRRRFYRKDQIYQQQPVNFYGN
ncbi:MAG: P-type conjugative transfer protein TrbJ [Janthinobacterium lividum]